MKTRVGEIVKWTKGPKILHVGCSDHVVRSNSKYWLHDYLDKNFLYVAGIDISESNIRAMKKLGYKNLSVANAENFEIDDTFDTIVAGELIEHLSNPGLFLSQAKKHLNPDGRLIITTPSPFSLQNFIYASFKYPKTCQNNEHAMWFCPQTLRSLAKRFGFKEEYFSLIRDYELDNPSFTYRMFAYTMVYLSFLFPKLWESNSMLFILTRLPSLNWRGSHL